jgi:regulator of sigma E protease
LDFLHKALIYIFVLGILVVVHEWGHFIAARIFKIKVEDFSIGFGPVALRLFKLGDTVYNLRWVPLGGFVRIAGMEPDDAPITYAAEKIAAARSGIPVSDEELANHPPIIEPPAPKALDPDTFFAHPAWQRAIVIFAGPLMSFVLGYLIFFGVPLTAGIPSGITLNKVDTVKPGSEAEKIGLKSGDTITGINGKSVSDGEALVTAIHASPGKPVTLIVQRNGATLTIVGVPQLTDLDGQKVGILGFSPVLKETHGKRASILESFNFANNITLAFFTTMGDFFSHPSVKSIRQNLGGPIMIAKVESQAAAQGPANLAEVVGEITMSLAVMNLLPIPILDGGYLMFFLVEALRKGKRLTFQEQQNFMLAGLAIIGMMFIFIMYNDITRLVHVPHP